jgi:hypothetical protein
METSNRKGEEKISQPVQYHGFSWQFISVKRKQRWVYWQDFQYVPREGALVTKGGHELEKTFVYGQI